jgi:hypothetical protein
VADPRGEVLELPPAALVHEGAAEDATGGLPVEGGRVVRPREQGEREQGAESQGR